MRLESHTASLPIAALVFLVVILTCTEVFPLSVGRVRATVESAAGHEGFHQWYIQV